MVGAFETSFNSLFWACHNVLYALSGLFCGLSIPSFGLVCSRSVPGNSIIIFQFPLLGLQLLDMIAPTGLNTFNSLFWAWKEEAGQGAGSHYFQFPLLGLCHHTTQTIKRLENFQFPLLGLWRKLVLLTQLSLYFQFPLLGLWTPTPVRPCPRRRCPLSIPSFGLDRESQGHCNGTIQTFNSLFWACV